MADDHTNSPTVTFDVGGKLFKTSRSLILQHEDTMLARLVSDTWQVDKTKPIFIDRNGTTFESILDYLRHGRITLPMTVSKEMFLLDMDFYGITHEEGSVKASTDEWPAQVSNRLDSIITVQVSKRLDRIVAVMDRLDNTITDVVRDEMLEDIRSMLRRIRAGVTQIKTHLEG
jgi:hypothetical protein